MRKPFMDLYRVMGREDGLLLETWSPGPTHYGNREDIPRLLALVRIRAVSNPGKEFVLVHNRRKFKTKPHDSDKRLQVVFSSIQNAGTGHVQESPRLVECFAANDAKEFSRVFAGLLACDRLSVVDHKGLQLLVPDWEYETARSAIPSVDQRRLVAGIR
jgi:hypothetical protein